MTASPALSCVDKSSACSIVVLLVPSVTASLESVLPLVEIPKAEAVISEILRVKLWFSLAPIWNLRLLPFPASFPSAPLVATVKSVVAPPTLASVADSLPDFCVRVNVPVVLTALYLSFKSAVFPIRVAKVAASLNEDVPSPAVSYFNVLPSIVTSSKVVDNLKVNSPASAVTASLPSLSPFNSFVC